MTKVNRTPTAAADFVVPEIVVELPDAKARDGSPACVRVGKLEVPVLAPIMEGLPVDAGEQAAEQAASLGNSARRLLEWYTPATKLIALSCIEPQFYFGEPEEGKANGAALTIRDIAELFNASLRVSGWTSEDDETSDMRRFPAGSNEGGRKASGPSGVSSDGAGATPEPAVEKAGEWPTLASAAGAGA